MLKVGIQGGEGSYHEMAARQFFGEDIDIDYIETFHELFDALKANTIERAVVAIANNRSQFIQEPYDAIVNGDEHFSIIGETYLRVEHALLAPEGSTMGGLLEVHSQSPALNQCSVFLEEKLPKIKIIEQHDTAGSAKMVAELNDITKAAIASRVAGEIYGLEVLSANIQDDPDNITRFLILANSQSTEEVSAPDKTSLLLKTPQVSGALVGALLPFRDAGINLSFLQSRIIANSPFDMIFFLEFEAGLNDPNTVEVLSQLKATDYEYQILGSYQRADIPHPSNANSSFLDKLTMSGTK